MLKRLISSFVCFCFIFTNFQYVHAQDFNINQLPTPGSMVNPSEAFSPLSLKGLVINPQKPLEFQFIVDTGKDPQNNVSIKEEANKLVKYFLAGLTIPEGELWVNLSPYEKNRITTQSLGQTELGRDLLAQDYILKQLTASLIYPEKDLGKEFWARVYSKAQQQFGTTNVPVNTFNKVWILPDQAQVFENGPAVFVTKSTLKVMLDEDYTALKKHTPINNRNDTHSIGSNIVRQIVLPEIEKEVNTGKNFAPLRQIYDAMILAKWYKETIENGLLDALYTNKNKTAGVNLTDPAVKEQIYQRYLQAYKKGVFNYIKEDPTPDGQMSPRKYFSGGITEIEPKNIERDGAMTAINFRGILVALTISLSALMPSAADAQQLNLSDQTMPTSSSQINDKKFQELLKDLNDKNTDDVVNAVDQLAFSGDKRAIEPLLKMLIDKGNVIPNYYANLVENALTKLGASKEQMLTGYRLGLAISNPFIRLRALDGLKRWGASKEELINGYLPILSTDDFKIAEDNLIKLGTNKEQMFNGYITILLPQISSDRFAEDNAVKKLGELGDKRAIEPIRKHLDDFSNDFYVDRYYHQSERSQIRDILIKLGAGWWDTRSDYERWVWKTSLAGILTLLIGSGTGLLILNRKENTVRLKIAFLKRTKNVAKVSKMLRDKDQRIRKAAIEAVAKLVTDPQEKAVIFLNIFELENYEGPVCRDLIEILHTLMPRDQLKRILQSKFEDKYSRLPDWVKKRINKVLAFDIFSKQGSLQLIIKKGIQKNREISNVSSPSSGWNGYEQGTSISYTVTEGRRPYTEYYLEDRFLKGDYGEPQYTSYQSGDSGWGGVEISVKESGWIDEKDLAMLDQPPAQKDATMYASINLKSLLTPLNLKMDVNSAQTSDAINFIERHPIFTAGMTKSDMAMFSIDALETVLTFAYWGLGFGGGVSIYMQNVVEENNPEFFVAFLMSLLIFNPGVITGYASAIIFHYGFIRLPVFTYELFNSMAEDYRAKRHWSELVRIGAPAVPVLIDAQRWAEIEKIGKAAIPSLVKALEKSVPGDNYNTISDLLHRLGDPRGSYRYKKVYRDVYSDKWIVDVEDQGHYEQEQDDFEGRTFHDKFVVDVPGSGHYVKIPNGMVFDHWEKVKRDSAMSVPIAQNKPNAAMMSVTSEQAIKYQEETHQRFINFDHEAEVQFSSSTDQLVVTRAIEKNNGTSESMFQHIQVSGNSEVRNIYQDVQKIVREVVGPNISVLDMNLDEIHVTIASDDIASKDKLTLTLDQLTKDITEDTQGVKSFNIQLVGPHLMRNGVVVMEYTTAAPEFLYLRQKAAQRISNRKLSEGNRVPDIIHSTVAVIRDPRVSQKTLRQLQSRLNEYRGRLQPITITVNKITATHFRESDRHFLESRDIQLEGSAMLGLPTTPPHLSSSRIQLAAQANPFSAQKLINTFKEDPFLREQLDQKLENHILKVFGQFEKYFANRPGIDNYFFKTLIVLHDIGKTMAIKNYSDVRRQNEYTLPIVIWLKASLPLSGDELKLLETLLESDPIGKLLESYNQNPRLFDKRDVVFRETVNEIKRMQKTTGMPMDMFWQYLIAYQQSDSTSYTKEADGEGRYDHQYAHQENSDALIMDNLKGRIRMNDILEPIYNALESDVKDKAQLAQDLGGIELNQIAIKRTGHVIKMQFDQAQLNQLEQGGFEGFTPVIINMTRISSPLPLLGIAQQKEDEMLAKL